MKNLKLEIKINEPVLEGERAFLLMSPAWGETKDCLKGRYIDHDEYIQNYG